MDNFRLTVQLKLASPSRRKAELIRKQQTEYQRAANWYLARVQELGTTSRAKLHRLTYAEACSSFDLNRGVMQEALLKAIAAQRSYLARKRKGKRASLPRFGPNTPISFRRDLYSIVETDNTLHYVARFPTGRGRSQIAVPVVVGEYQTQHLRNLMEGRCRQGSAELFEHGGEWYLHIVLVYPATQRQVKTVIGVDVGVVNLAVASTPDGSVNRFWNGRQVRWRRERWAERRGRLQQAGRLSRVKRGGGREQRWMLDINRKIARELVDLAVTHDAAIALEELAGIRNRSKLSKRTRRMVNNWNFYQLRTCIETAAVKAGVPVITVDPRSTSRTCSRCGSVARGNRKGQGWYSCADCGFELSADLNAARNIAQRALDATGACPGGDGSVTPHTAQGGAVMHHTS